MKPSDFKLNCILSDFIKLGTLVIFIDNSYATDIKGNKALPSFDEGIFRVIDNNKPFLTNRTGSIPSICSPINNIKVRNIYTGKVYFCSNLNLQSIQHGNVLGNSEPCVIYRGQLKTVKDVFFTYPPHW